MSQPFAIDLRHPPLVLAGTSLGPESDAVVRAALRLARAGRGQVYLSHALEPPPVPGGATAFALAEPHLAARAHVALQEQLDRVGASAEEVVGFEAKAGPAGPVLCAAADRLNADVIVVAALAAAPLPLHRVGSTAVVARRGGLRAVLAGSVRHLHVCLGRLADHGSAGCHRGADTRARQVARATRSARQARQRKRHERS